jgi:hypothetical protein
MMTAQESCFKTQEALMTAWKNQEEHAEQQEKWAIRFSHWEAKVKVATTG